MREQIASLRTAAERARAVATTERAALPPPQQRPPRGGVAGDCGDVVGSTRHLLFDRLADATDVEPFAGAELSSPLVMPVELSLPEQVLCRSPQPPPPPADAMVCSHVLGLLEQIWSLADVSDCLQRAAHACGLLSNQRELVAHTYALRLSLLQVRRLSLSALTPLSLFLSLSLSLSALSLSRLSLRPPPRLTRREDPFWCRSPQPLNPLQRRR